MQATVHILTDEMTQPLSEQCSIIHTVSQVMQAPSYKALCLCVLNVCLSAYLPVLLPGIASLWSVCLPIVCFFWKQVSIDAPVASIATLALHKWLQDLHQKIQTDGPACLRKRIVLSVGHWSRTPSQTPAWTPAKADTAPQIPPEEEASASESGAQEAASAAMRAANESGPSNLGTRAVAGRNPQAGQKRMASALPAVAAKIFGPEHDAAANQEVILNMVRGFGLPFKAVDASDSFALEASAEAVAEWLQSGQFDAAMTGFAQPVSSPTPGVCPHL